MVNKAANTTKLFHERVFDLVLVIYLHYFKYCWVFVSKKLFCRAVYNLQGTWLNEYQTPQSHSFKID